MMVQRQAASKPVILTFVPTYLPGYKGGGPIRSISNMVEALGDEFEFVVVTADRDAGDEAPYENALGTGGWTQVGKAKVFYLPPSGRSFRDIRAIIQTTPHDVLYLNSFFSPDFTTKPLLVRKLLGYHRKPCVIAPRGEFSPGALALKRWKKLPFIALMRTLRLYEGVTWQASAEYDAKDIQLAIKAKPGDVRLAMETPSLPAGAILEHQPRQPNTPLRVCFVSRISPKKNLEFALRTLKAVPIPVRFQIYGPIEDTAYYRRCQKLIGELPKHVEAAFAGGVSHEGVRTAFASNDLFFFPTLGENYGHVIEEALAAGTPVLISDRTPWRDLDAAGVGWDLPLEAGPDAFVAKILDANVRARSDGVNWRKRAASFASGGPAYLDRLEATRRLFSF